MVVVSIVSIVAVLAIPTMSQAGYDRRAFTDAANIAELVREARTRAVGRGAAILLSMATNAGTNAATFTLYESVSANPGGAAGSNIPVSTCGSPTVWPGAGGTATANLVDGFTLAGTVAGGTAKSIEGMGNIVVRVNDAGGNLDVADSGTTQYLCFTPNGRVTYAVGPGPTNFQPMTGAIGAVTVDVTRGAFPSTLGGTSSTSVVRTVWIPPSGATRMTSK
jgi:Tfp pilus assembly protein FimT